MVYTYPTTMVATPSQAIRLQTITVVAIAMEYSQKEATVVTPSRTMCFQTTAIVAPATACTWNTMTTLSWVTSVTITVTTTTAMEYF